MIRAPLLLVMLVAAPLLPTGSATAATYTVAVCDDAVGGVNNAFQPENSDPAHFEVIASCPGSGLGANALTARDRPGTAGWIVAGTRAGWRITAPNGTTITRIALRRSLGQAADNDKVPRVEVASGALVDPSETCMLGPSESLCERKGTADYAVSSSSLWFGLVCEPQNGTSVCTTGATLNEGWATLHGATVTISQLSAPTIATPTGGITSGGWLKGEQLLELASLTDASGIRSVTLTIDGRAASLSAPAPAPAACDFTRPRPCADMPSSSWSVQTTGMGDGEHTAVVTAVNAAGLTATRAVTFRSDQTPPAAPLALTPASSGWRADRRVPVRWSLPPQGAGSPVDAARVELCGPGGGCRTLIAGSLTGEDLDLTDGTWRASVQLHDAAGWGEATSRTIAVDGGAPPAPTGVRTTTAGWATSQVVPLTWDEPEIRPDRAPIVSTRIRVCDAAGLNCGPVDEPEVTSGASVTVPAEGIFVVKVNGRQAAGVFDDAVAGEAVVRVSTTPPTVDLTDARVQSGTFDIAATVAAAAGGPAPLKSVSWRLCGASSCPSGGTAAGATIATTVPSAGTWTLSVDVVDEANNSATDSVTITVPPTTDPTPRRDGGGQEPPDDNDPGRSGGQDPPPVVANDPPAGGQPPQQSGSPQPRTSVPLALGLRLRSVRLVGSTIAFSAATSTRWTGRVKVDFRYRAGRRTVAARAWLRVRGGKGSGRLRLRHSPAKGRLTLSVNATPAYGAAATTRVVRRRFGKTLRSHPG